MIKRSQTNSSTTGQRSLGGSLRHAGHSKPASIPVTSSSSASKTTSKSSRSFSARPPKEMRAAFWQHVAKGAPDECWEYHQPSAWGDGTQWVTNPLVRLPDGQGHTSPARFAWACVHGTLDAKQFVTRSCKNKLCVNPAHLALSSAPAKRPRSTMRFAGATPSSPTSPATPASPLTPVTPVTVEYLAGKRGGEKNQNGNGDGKAPKEAPKQSEEAPTPQTANAIIQHNPQEDRIEMTLLWPPHAYQLLAFWALLQVASVILLIALLVGKP